jgi:hypothetical protein
VISSVCENNRPFESARTVSRPDMRMLNVARGHPQPVAHHENYFRESPAPDTWSTKEAGFPIISRGVMIIDEEPMPCYDPVISPEGDVTSCMRRTTSGASSVRDWYTMVARLITTLGMCERHWR